MSDLKIKLWVKDHAGEEDAKEVEALSRDHRSLCFAAENYAEKRFYDLDYPSELEVMVRDYDGILWQIDVEVRAEPTFYASKPKQIEPTAKEGARS